MGNDMVEKEAGDGKSHVIEFWHGLCPLGEIVNCDYDIFMTDGRCGSAFHKIHAPFAKGADSDDRM